MNPVLVRFVFTVTFSAVEYPLFVTVIVYVAVSSKYNVSVLVFMVNSKTTSGVTLIKRVSLLFEVLVSRFVVFTFTINVVFSVICIVIFSSAV